MSSASKSSLHREGLSLRTNRQSTALAHSHSIPARELVPALSGPVIADRPADGHSSLQCPVTVLGFISPSGGPWGSGFPPTTDGSQLLNLIG